MVNVTLHKKDKSQNSSINGVSSISSEKSPNENSNDWLCPTMSRWYGLWLLSSTAYFLLLFSLFLWQAYFLSDLCINPIPQTMTPILIPLYKECCYPGLFVVGSGFFFFFSYDWLLHVIQVWIQTCPSQRGFHGHQSKGVPPYFILTLSTTFLDRIFQSIYHYLELSYLIVCLFMNSSAMRVTYVFLKIIKLCEITYY